MICLLKWMFILSTTSLMVLDIYTTNHLYAHNVHKSHDLCLWPFSKMYVHHWGNSKAMTSNWSHFDNFGMSIGSAKAFPCILKVDNWLIHTEYQLTFTACGPAPKKTIIQHPLACYKVNISTWEKHVIQSILGTSMHCAWVRTWTCGSPVNDKRYSQCS